MGLQKRRSMTYKLGSMGPRDESKMLFSYLERNNRLTQRIRNRNTLRRIPDSRGKHDKDEISHYSSPELVFDRSPAKDSASGSSQSTAPVAGPSAPVPTGLAGVNMVQRQPDTSKRETGRENEPAVQRPENIETNGTSQEDKGSKTVNAEEVAEKVYRLMQRDLILERERTPRLEVK